MVLGGCPACDPEPEQGFVIIYSVSEKMGRRPINANRSPGFRQSPALRAFPVRASTMPQSLPRTGFKFKI